MKTRAAALLAVLAAACAPRFDPRLVDAPIAGRRWVSTEELRHPLVGRIWEPRAARFVDEAALAAAVAGADFVALGEVHDNPDHHLLQARLLRVITAAGRRPALAFEMLDADQQPRVDAAIAAAPRDPDALAKAVGWKESRWPDFRFYRPIVAAGLEAGLPIVAANVPRKTMKEIRAKGKDALEPELRLRLDREEPFSEAMIASLRAEMAGAHCGELPDAMLGPLVLAQRARDARMAERMTTAGADRGAVLVTGKGHARNDRGVPVIVAKDAPGKKVLSVAFVEVEADQLDPASYRDDEDGSGPAPYDLVVFTPGAKREDPCEGMRAHMEKKRKEAKDGQAGKEATPQAAPDPAGASSTAREGAPARP